MHGIDGQTTQSTSEMRVDLALPMKGTGVWDGSVRFFAGASDHTFCRVHDVIEAAQTKASMTVYVTQNDIWAIQLNPGPFEWRVGFNFPSNID